MIFDAPDVFRGVSALCHDHSHVVGNDHVVFRRLARRKSVMGADAALLYGFGRDFDTHCGIGIELVTATLILRADRSLTLVHSCQLLRTRLLALF